jgi:hypothetical protein
MCCEVLAAGDWLAQYAPGDYGIVRRARFEAAYRIADHGGC